MCYHVLPELIKSREAMLRRVLQQGRSSLRRLLRVADKVLPLTPSISLSVLASWVGVSIEPGAERCGMPWACGTTLQVVLRKAAWQPRMEFLCSV